MLSDGSIIDSTRLPPNAIERYPVTFTGASASSSDHPPATVSGSSGPPLDSNHSTTPADTSSTPEGSRQEPQLTPHAAAVADIGGLRSAPASGAGPWLGPGVESIQEDPLLDSEGNLMDSEALRSSAEPLNRTGGLSRNMPAGYSAAISVRSAPGSTREPALDYSSDSVRRMAQDYPLTFSDISMADTTAALSAVDAGRADSPSRTGQYLPDSSSIQSSRNLAQEYPLTFPEGSNMESMQSGGALRTQPGSVSGYPAAYDTDSGMESMQGHPLESSRGIISSGAMRSAPGSVRGHPLSTSGTLDRTGNAGRGDPVRLSNGSYVYSSYLSPESLQGSQLPYMESGTIGSYGEGGELESLPEGSVIGSMRDIQMHQSDSPTETNPALQSQPAFLETGRSTYSQTGNPLTAPGGVHSSGTAIRSAPGSVRGSVQRMDESTSSSNRGRSSSSPDQPSTEPTSSSHSHVREPPLHLLHSNLGSLPC